MCQRWLETRSESSNICIMQVIVTAYVVHSIPCVSYTYHASCAHTFGRDCMDCWKGWVHDYTTAKCVKVNVSLPHRLLLSLGHAHVKFSGHHLSFALVFLVPFSIVLNAGGGLLLHVKSPSPAWCTYVSRMYTNTSHIYYRWTLISLPSSGTPCCSYSSGKSVEDSHG